MDINKINQKEFLIAQPITKRYWRYDYCFAYLDETLSLSSLKFDVETKNVWFRYQFWSEQLNVLLFSCVKPAALSDFDNSILCALYSGQPSQTDGMPYVPEIQSVLFKCCRWFQRVLDRYLLIRYQNWWSISQKERILR